MGRCIRAATSLYRVLLVLYPAPFRREYGSLMVAAFEKMCEEAAEEGGPWALVRLWRHTLYDLTTSVLVEHLEQQVGDEVTFVPVTVYAAPTTTAGSDTPRFNLENWDLYLVPPYDTWLPPLQETHFGLALQAPVYTLVDSRGNVVSQMHHFPDVGRVVEAE